MRVRALAHVVEPDYEARRLCEEEEDGPVILLPLNVAEILAHSVRRKPLIVSDSQLAWISVGLIPT